MTLEIHPLLAQRRSPRAIDPNRPVPREVTQRLLEAARWAPSSGNSQPWRFVVVDAPDALARAREALHPGNQRWANRAPLLLLICANPQDDGDINGQPLYLFDCGLAAENLLLQGTAEGLVFIQWLDGTRISCVLRWVCPIPTGLWWSLLSAIPDARGFTGGSAETRNGSARTQTAIRANTL